MHHHLHNPLQITMQHSHPPAISSAVFLFLTVFLLSTATKAHNITDILAEFPNLSTFNDYLTLTRLDDDINHREAITVCAVDNAGMVDLLSKNYSTYTMRNVLSLHLLLDYFGAKKLHEISNGTVLAASMYQESGEAHGSSGFVNITDLSGGKVGFGAVDSGVLDATFIKSIKEIPYNISVIQISKALSSIDAAVPTPPPSQLNLPDLMSPHGCKTFALALLNSSALITFDDSVSGGVTIFCPNDDSMKNFLPKFNNLTTEGQESLLEFHGVPIYMSLPMLKTNNGPVNTLATDGNNKYNFVIQNDGQDVTLKTRIVTAKILSTLKDENPLSIFVLDKVLIPPELVSLYPTPTPAPAPAPSKMDSPASGKHKSPPTPAGAVDSPAEGPAADDAVQTNSGREIGLDRGKFVMVTLSTGIVCLLLL